MRQPFSQEDCVATSQPQQQRRLQYSVGLPVQPLPKAAQAAGARATTTTASGRQHATFLKFFTKIKSTLTFPPTNISLFDQIFHILHVALIFLENIFFSFIFFFFFYWSCSSTFPSFATCYFSLMANDDEGKTRLQCRREKRWGVG